MAEETDVTTTDVEPAPGTVPGVDGMPMLGFGTWKLSDPETCVRAVTTALEVGYRHVDTARAYGNEAAIGDAIDRSDVDREDVFLATKIWIDDLGSEDAVEAGYDSLQRLGTDYLDLLYVHWPAGEYEPERTLAAFDRLHEEGVTDRIGVSNFQPDQLETACRLADAPIFANQFECHPALPQRDLVAACERRDVRPVAYAPLARGRVGDVPEVAAVAADNGVTATRVSLAWLRQRGIAAIPKATSRAHVEDNWRSLTLRLDEAAMERIDSVDQRQRLVDPDFAPWP